MASHPRPEFIGLSTSTNAPLPPAFSSRVTAVEAAAQPVASTSRGVVGGPASTAATEQTTHQQQPQARKMRKKKPGRGRMMTVKVFYSLTSSRFSSTISTPTLTSASATSNGFLSAHDSVTPSSGSAPSPSPEPGRPSPQQQSYTCLARLSAPVWVQLLGSPPSPREDDDEAIEYGRLTLKTCLSTICISRPELVTDPTQDYAISALDPYESSLQPGPSHISGSNSGTSGPQGLMEGKGMLSWTLAEKREGTTFVCGRVVLNEQEKERRRRKRRRVDSGEKDREVDEDEDDESDDDSVKETLEVWLQLVERPTFTQTQFLTSLRSFAYPAQTHMSSDHASPPARRPLLQSSQTNGYPVGDPVKRKRPRESAEQRLPVSLPPPATASTASTSLPQSPFAPPPPPSFVGPALRPTPEQLQDPRVRALLAQIIPSLAGKGDASAPAALPLSLDSEAGRQLLPAIRTLAQYYNVDLSSSVSGLLDSTAAAAAADIQVGEAMSASVLDMPSSSRQAATTSNNAKAARPTGAAGNRKNERFVPVENGNNDPADRSNPHDPSGCFNCRRKKSAVWRECHDDEGQRRTVCNACGVFYNKNGHHRSVKGDRTTSPQRSASGSGSTSTSKVGRPLQARLTAVCEQDLKKRKSRKGSTSSASRVPGMIPPPSPSKIVGPNRSPSNSFGPWGHMPRLGGHSHTMTSPGRSPRRKNSATTSAMFGLANTSPARGKAGGLGAGLRSGYESDGEGRGNAYSYAANIFGGDQSPSPEKPSQRQMPTYLLTASPGTALDRILNETNIDLHSFDMPMPDAVEQSRRSSDGEGHKITMPRSSQLAETDEDEQSGISRDLSFYLKSMTPSSKENKPPQSTADLFSSMIDPSLLSGTEESTSTSRFAHINTTDAPTTELDNFDSVLSSLRRDFNTRLSSNALTAPSSPIPSSPCVQPRTSSATPGNKSKAPQSCGRPAPSNDHGFLDDLVPAILRTDEHTPASDSDAYTPASDLDGDRTLTLDSLRPGAGHTSKGSTKRAPSQSRTAGFLATRHMATTSDVEFDLGSLPPSSPPMLPSEAFPTPSDFEGITPDGDGYVDEQSRPAAANGASAEQQAMMTLLQSIGESGAAGLGSLLSGSAANGAGGDKIQLDRATVNKLLTMLSANGGGGGVALDGTGIASPALSAHSPAMQAAGTSGLSKEVTAIDAQKEVDLDPEGANLTSLYNDMFA